MKTFNFYFCWYDKISQEILKICHFILVRFDYITHRIGFGQEGPENIKINFRDGLLRFSD